MAALQAQTQQYRGLVNRVELEDAELKQKLINLEANLSNFTPDRIRALKVCSHTTPSSLLFSRFCFQQKRSEEHTSELQ